jgi:hypothetical protein
MTAFLGGMEMARKVKEFIPGQWWLDKDNDVNLIVRPSDIGDSQIIVNYIKRDDLLCIDEISVEKRQLVRQLTKAEATRNLTRVVNHRLKEINASMKLGLKVPVQQVVKTESVSEFATTSKKFRKTFSNQG